jgi:capsular exopolysaccharide synthesis family protein
MVIGLVAATLATIYIITMKDRPLYQATVQMMPTDTALYRPILPSPGSSAGSLADRQTGSQLPNLMSLIKSRKVAERTIHVASLDETPDGLIGRIEVSTTDNPGARTRQEMGTDIISIMVSDSEPKRATRTVNALAHVYSSFYQEISHQEATDNLRFLESELAKADRNLQASTDMLKDFKRSNNATSADEVSGAAAAGLRQATTERDLTRAQMAESQAKLGQIDKQLRHLKPTRTVITGTSDTPMVAQLNVQLADLIRQLNDAQAKYQSTHPKVVALKGEIDQVQSKLRSEQGRIKHNISIVSDPVYESLLAERSKTAYERDGLAARLGQMQSVVAAAQAAVKPGVDVDLKHLENEFQSAQTNYTNLQSQVSQARINVKQTTGTGAIRIIDEAERAEGPIGTNKAIFLLTGAILSLLIGGGLALTMESLDNRIKSTGDIERLLGLSVTAAIPSAEGSSHSQLARITDTHPLSPISEAYRFLRTDLLLTSQLNGARTIMVATPKPGQGGTNTVSNLGISLAQDGKRVVVIDADMRRPSLHAVFKVANDFGLSNVLSNEKEFEEVILATDIDNLLVIPAGPTPSNPSELLGSERMKLLVERLVEIADYVLIDTPSAVAFTDAVVLSRVVDAVLLVVRANQVPRKAELQVRDLLLKANANIMGVVLNDVDPDTVDSYHYHSHYYPEVGFARRGSIAPTAIRSIPPRSEQG